MSDLRQKTYGVFIRPYITFGGDKIVQRSSLYVPDPASDSGKDFISVRDGEGWILYKGEYLTSFPLVRERVKEIMDNLGYSKNDIIVAEIIPADIIVTPLT